MLECGDYDNKKCFVTFDFNDKSLFFSLIIITVSDECREHYQVLCNI